MAVWYRVVGANMLDAPARRTAEAAWRAYRSVCNKAYGHDYLGPDMSLAKNSGRLAVGTTRKAAEEARLTAMGGANGEWWFE